MKKILLATGALTCILVLNVETANAQTQTTVFPIGDPEREPVSLHAAAQNAAAEFYSNLESSTRIAVVAMEANSARMSSYLIDEMIIALAMASAGGLIVANRNLLDQAAQELHFQTSQGADEAAARSVGRFLGVQAIVMGALEPVGDYFYFRVQVIDVETGATLGIHDANVQNDRTIAFLRGEAHIHTQQQVYAPHDEDQTRFWSVGFSVGTGFSEPLVLGTLQATLAPLRYSFIRVGSDLGLMTNTEGADYFSMSMFAHYSLFLPFAIGGWHIGAGGSFTLAEYRFEDIAEPRRGFAVDLVTGVKLINLIDISYTLRTNFSTMFSNRISVGFTYRFLPRSR